VGLKRRISYYKGALHSQYRLRIFGPGNGSPMATNVVLVVVVVGVLGVLSVARSNLSFGPRSFRAAALLRLSGTVSLLMSALVLLSQHSVNI